MSCRRVPHTLPEEIAPLFRNIFHLGKNKNYSQFGHCVYNFVNLKIMIL